MRWMLQDYRWDRAWNHPVEYSVRSFWVNSLGVRGYLPSGTKAPRPCCASCLTPPLSLSLYPLEAGRAYGRVGCRANHLTCNNAPSLHRSHAMYHQWKMDCAKSVPESIVASKPAGYAMHLLRTGQPGSTVVSFDQHVMGLGMMSCHWRSVRRYASRPFIF